MCKIASAFVMALCMTICGCRCADRITEAGSSPDASSPSLEPYRNALAGDARSEYTGKAAVIEAIEDSDDERTFRTLLRGLAPHPTACVVVWYVGVSDSDAPGAYSVVKRFAVFETASHIGFLTNVGDAFSEVEAGEVARFRVAAGYLSGACAKAPSPAGSSAWTRVDVGSIASSLRDVRAEHSELSWGGYTIVIVDGWSAGVRGGIVGINGLSPDPDKRLPQLVQATVEAVARLRRRLTQSEER